MDAEVKPVMGTTQLWAGTDCATHTCHCDLWHRGRNRHQTVLSVLLQGVMLAGDKQSPRCTMSSAAAQPLLDVISASIPHQCWNADEQTYALFPYYVSPGCVQGPVAGSYLLLIISAVWWRKGIIWSKSPKPNLRPKSSYCIELWLMEMGNKHWSSVHQQNFSGQVVMDFSLGLHLKPVAVQIKAAFSSCSTGF